MEKLPCLWWFLDHSVDAVRCVYRVFFDMFSNIATVGEVEQGHTSVAQLPFFAT